MSPSKKFWSGRWSSGGSRWCKSISEVQHQHLRTRKSMQWQALKPTREKWKKDAEEEEEYLCCEESSISYQLYSSHFPPDKEKKISVDPLITEATSKGGRSFITIITTTDSLPPLGKPEFISCSLPGSALSSPKSGSTTTKSFNKWKIPPQQPHPALLSLARQQSTNLSHFSQRQGRSKSCGEGRSSSPSDEFDIVCGRPSTKLLQNGVHILYDCTNEAGNYLRTLKSSILRLRKTSNAGHCACFCPLNFSKKKQAEASRDEQEELWSTVSRVGSLEKFECGSWSPCAILDGDDEEDEGGESYFDLPVELIRSSTDDANSPVKDGFCVWWWSERVSWKRASHWSDMVSMDVLIKFKSFSKI